MWSFLLTLNIFTPCSAASIVDFEQRLYKLWLGLYISYAFLSKRTCAHLDLKENSPLMHNVAKWSVTL